MVAMTSFVDSNVDPANSRVIELRDVSMEARSMDDGRWEVDEEERSSKTPKLTFALPVIVELPATRSLSDEYADSTGTDMLRSDGKPKSARPGRKYKPAQVQSFTNGHHHHQHQSGVGAGKATSSSSPSTSPRDWRSSLREGSNGHSTTWNSSLASPKMHRASTPRSPRVPRRLPSLVRSDSEESAMNSPRADRTVTFDDGGSEGNRNANGLNGEAVNHDEEGWVNSVYHHIPLPTSSSVFQQIMTDLNDRSSPASLDTSSPGDLMVRRSSLARTTLGSPPLLLDAVTQMSELGLDIELTLPPGSDHDDDKEETKTGESQSHSVGNATSHNHHYNRDKKHNSQANEDNAIKINAKNTSPRRHIKFPAESRLPTCAITNEDTTSKPGIVISVPTEDSLLLTASTQGLRGQRPRSRSLRSRSDTATSVSGESYTGSSEMSTSSPERSPKPPRRKISDQSLRHPPVTPARSRHHEHEAVIDMKTAGQIIRFITAAAASSTAPGLNRNQQLLPSDVRLPVVDPTGRLLHRNRDEAMRLVKQAVDHSGDRGEKSDVYSWDELRDCRYLRTRKNPKESRRNSLLGFNEI